MKFLVDAQLPVRLARLLQEAGYDIIHTRELPQQNATSDSSINSISIQEERVVITKDSDFVDSFLTVQQPYKLLLVTTGNIQKCRLRNSLH
jgi:predicted nuclease of predicted toxin-antitoxin system